MGVAVWELSSRLKVTEQGSSSGFRRNLDLPRFCAGIALTDAGFADHLLSNSSGDRYPGAECRGLRL